MLLRYVLENKVTIYKHSNIINKILIAFTWLLLFFVRPTKNKIFTDQALHEFLSRDNRVYCDNRYFEDFDSKKLEFNTNKNTAVKTILLNVNIIYLKQALTLYTTIKEGRCHVKNIKIRITGAAEFYKTHKKTLETCGVISFYRKHFLACKYDEQACNHYFAVFNVNYGSESLIKINPMKNIMPNADLMHISMLNFPIRYKITTYNTPWSIKYINVIDITIRKNISEQSKFVLLLRNFCNLHSHSLGNYYYFILSDSHINVISVFPFIVCSIARAIFMSFANAEDTFYNSKLLPMIAYPFFNYVVLLYGKILDINYSQQAFVIGVSSVINFKFGFVYSLMCLLRASFQ